MSVRVGDARYSWDRIVDARKAADELAEKYGNAHRVVSNGDVFYETGGTTTMAVTTAAGHIDQPLLIPRESLIKRLEERVEERKAAHEKAIEEAKAKAQRAIDFLQSIVNADPAAVALAFQDRVWDARGYETMDEAKEQFLKNYSRTPEKAELVPDANLERLIRTLQLATATENVEVRPGDPVYPLL